MANYVFFHQTDDGWQNLAVDEFLLRNVGRMTSSFTYMSMLLVLSLASIKTLA